VAELAAVLPALPSSSRVDVLALAQADARRSVTQMHRAIERFKPKVVVFDPVSSLLSVASSGDVHGTMTRLIDYLKSSGVTALLTSLTHGKTEIERTDVAISSIVDTWLLLVTLESSGERNRGLYVLKSRGMSHSNQIREFLLTDNGVDLIDVYAGAGGVLTGSARLSQEAEERAAALVEEQELERRQRALTRLKTAFEAELAALQARFETEQVDLASTISQHRARVARLRDDQREMAQSRRADAPNGDQRPK